MFICLFGIFTAALHYCITGCPQFYPGMLSAQLVGRLLPEIEHSDNIRNLLQQCDTEGIKQNALVPTYHSMHTPGGPLKANTAI